MASLQLTTANTDSQSGHGGGSPLSGTNEASLSPSGGSTATGLTAGPLSPGAVSQSSHHAGHKGLSTSPAEDVVGGDVPVGLSSAAQDLPSRGSCCENGRPIITDPVSGQTVCSCQYDPARLAIGGYSRMALPSGGVGVGVYGGPYPSNEQNPYPSIGVDNSAFYAPLVRIGYELGHGNHWVAEKSRLIGFVHSAKVRANASRQAEQISPCWPSAR